MKQKLLLRRSFKTWLDMVPSKLIHFILPNNKCYTSLKCLNAFSSVMGLFMKLAPFLLSCEGIFEELLLFLKIM